jgi:hypothetical protein
VTGYATTATVRIDEEILQLGAIVVAGGDGSEPDDLVLARWASHRDQGTTGGNTLAGEDQELRTGQQHRCVAGV